jgi:riboflavin biosynthesis pyrimidine reductase
MFDEGEFNWPEKSPLGTPVYVLTHRLREPWKRTGTTCYFINDKIESVLKEAKKAAGNKDVRISGGSATIQQYLNAGLVDQPTIPSAPLLPGKGFHLFENIDKGQVFPGNPGGHQFSTCNTSEILSRQQMKYEVGTSYFALLTLFHFRMIFIMPPPELFSPVLLRL